MKKKVILAMLALVIAASFAGAAFAAEGFSKDAIKRMSTFISNFTELFMFDLPDAQNLADDQYAEFGVMHEWVNNGFKRFKQGKDGTASIEASHIENAVMRYFGRKFTAHCSVWMGDGQWEIKYDPKTKRYTIPMADGEQRPQARVESVTQNADGTLTMTGKFYAEEGDKKVAIGTFTARAKPHKWNGRDTWALLSLLCEHTEE